MEFNSIENMKRLAGGSVVENSSADSSMFTRTFAYIDGFNLYYGVNSLTDKTLKWASLSRLMKCFLAPTENLIETNLYNHRLGIIKMTEVHLNQAKMPNIVDINGIKIQNPYL